MSAAAQTLNSPFIKAAQALGFEQWDMLLCDPKSIPFRKFIAHLENQKIRCYKKGERSICQNLGGKDWPKKFRKYLEDVGCPFQCVDQKETKSNTSAIFWLVAHALAFQYEDKKSSYNEQTLQQKGFNKKGNEGLVVKVGVNETLMKLGASVGLGAAELDKCASCRRKMETIESVISKKLSHRNMRLAKQKAQGQDNSKTYHLTTEEFPLGFKTGKASVDKAAIVLKMLYLSQLRELQQSINHVLNLAQDEFTGNPVTDCKLGKVGR